MEIPSDGEAAEFPEDCILFCGPMVHSLVGQAIAPVRGASHRKRFLERID
jgi:hypothetical protein